jgi:hypothetical protein
MKKRKRKKKNKKPQTPWERNDIMSNKTTNNQI